MATRRDHGLRTPWNTPERTFATTSSDIPLGDGYGSLALLPTESERQRRLTARLLAGDGRPLAAVLEPLRGRFDLALIDTPAGDTVFGRQAIMAADAAIVPGIIGVRRNVEFISEDRRGSHWHFADQVLHANPYARFPWRLLTVWE